MPMHEKARQRMVGRLRETTDPTFLDQLLEQLFDCEHRATEWDAGRWGFDPDRWMERERAELARRGGQCWPTEPVLRTP